MRQVPECMHRRYKAMADLMKELNQKMGNQLSSNNDNSSPDEKAVRLMVEFWQILEEDPDYNLPEGLRKIMGVNAGIKTDSNNRVNDLLCYAVQNCGSNRSGCNEEKKSTKTKSPCDPTCCDLPLSDVLCNLREATMSNQSCEQLSKELQKRQVELDGQIKVLEKKQEAGAKLLKEADAMWSTMEDMYKSKMAEQNQKTKDLASSVKQIEDSRNKWRKNKIEFEEQLKEIKAFEKEVVDKINKKMNDLVTIEAEVECHKKKTEANKNTIATLQKSMNDRRAESDKTIKTINDEIKVKEDKIEKIKSGQGESPLKRERDELKRLTTQLMQMQLQYEKAVEQKETKSEELKILRDECEICKKECEDKQSFLETEVKRIGEEITDFKFKCSRCAVGTETSAFNKFCTDCAHCQTMKECHVGEDSCSIDINKECVCTTTKFKFLDNVFEHMYTILEKQSKTRNGKNLAEFVLASLNRSKNGKLDDEARLKIKRFIMDTIKNNLNTTIVGGATKTRCEMSPETHELLMSCLKSIKVKKFDDLPKESKGTTARKDPCHRWKKFTECQCSKGPSSCVCQSFEDAMPSPKTEDKSNKVILSCPHRGPQPDPPRNLTLGGCVSCPLNKESTKTCALAADVFQRPSRPLIDNTERDQFDVMDYTSHWVASVGSDNKRNDSLRTLIEDVVGPYSFLTPLEKQSFTAVSDKFIGNE